MRQAEEARITQQENKAGLAARIAREECLAEEKRQAELQRIAKEKESGMNTRSVKQNNEE